MASGPAGSRERRPRAARSRATARTPAPEFRVRPREAEHRCRQSPAQRAVWKSDTLPYPDLSRDIPAQVGIAKLFGDMFG